MVLLLVLMMLILVIMLVLMFKLFIFRFVDIARRYVFTFGLNSRANDILMKMMLLSVKFK